MNKDAVAFAQALFDNVPEELHTLLWNRQDKLSTWIPLRGGSKAVAEQVQRLGDKERDLYVAVSVSRNAGEPNRRITAERSAGIMGLWADIDIADPDVHKKWNLPPDDKSALALLEKMGLEPTVLVHSGHGLQAWWLFDEFWEFDTEQARMEAASLAQRWNTTLRVRAAEHDWTVDSTFDLARVMRVPGTFNHKSEPVMPVSLLHVKPVRYVADDFERYIVDDSVIAQLGLSPSRQYVVAGLTLAENANPPFDKFEALSAAEPLFAQSWNRKRKDLHDQSGSSYDMSLASLAARTGWSDQEIADLIIASRRKHGDDLSKALRIDYISRTISRARDGINRDVAAEVMDEVVEELRDAKRSGDDEEIKTSRRKTMETISQQLEIEVLYFVKFTSDPPAYQMVTPTHLVNLGGAGGILGWPAFRESVVAATGHMVPRFKQAGWDRIAQAIFNSCEEQDIGLESTEAGQVYVWLSEYLMARPPTDDLEQAVLSEYPFKDERGTHIFGGSFRRWLWLSRGERVSNKDLGRMLRAFGCVPFKMNVTVDGSKSSRSAWTLPASVEGRG